MEGHVGVLLEETVLALNGRLKAIATTVYCGLRRTRVFAILAGKTVVRLARVLPIVGSFLRFQRGVQRGLRPFASKLFDKNRRFLLLVVSISVKKRIAQSSKLTMVLFTLAFFASDADAFSPDEDGCSNAVVGAPADVSSCAAEGIVLAFARGEFGGCGEAEYCRAAGRRYGSVCLSMEKVEEALINEG